MRVVDLFCGCGGLSKGFERAGYNVVAGLDNWDPAIRVYERNFTHPIIKQDLSDVESTVKVVKEMNPDMIIGGPPCQDFSSAGKRDEDNGRGCLTVSYAEIVCAIKPQWFVMENVERIIQTNKLIVAKQLFSSAGYGLSQMVLDASLCGVPQKRKRFVLIGKLGEKDNFMDYYLKKHMSVKSMSVFDYVGDSFGITYYYRHPRSYARRGVFSIYEPSPTIRGVNRPLPKGYKKHDGDPVDCLDKFRP